MGDGRVKDIIGYDGEPHRTAFKPAPPIAEIKRRPTETMLWHLRHKPHGSGGDANADGTAEGKTAIRE